ncbi:hypothetical protein [Hyperthermus butylicus]|uniref:Uncharacterized protein n=1 Tax=Hyperthermus butylicus (strain DSM 5456 / JCM 9403 / PLM1-5) TaxID=415426 RepID=A2BLA8_HYPBU|nr:hypothetical protein [Hyperthermus butylicus]ABM80769.1 hypothetical protein Hbut_0921 [Hyperthermus butylicus DSM 5456]
MSEDLLMLIDKYLGDMIEHIVYKYRYNVDLEEEYEQLLKFIYRRLVRAWFRGKDVTYEEFEAALRSARRKRRQLEILLSYLISRYAARNGPIYMPTGHDWYDERY